MIAKITAVVIFLAMFTVIILDKFERQYVSLVCGLIMMVVVFGVMMRSPKAMIETLNIGCIFKKSFWYGGGSEVSVGINWSTIVFIAGMMVMVEGMAKAGVFRWLCLRIAKLVHYHTVPIFLCFTVLAAFLSMFIDSITVILFLAAVTTELARTLKFDPIPMILSEIFCANLGGSSTMCGDPPNIIIGTSLGLTFGDFLTNTGMIAGVCFAAALIYFFLCFRKELKASEANRDPNVVYPEPKEAIENKTSFATSLMIFAVAVVLLVTHAQTTLTVAMIGVIAAVLTLIFSLAIHHVQGTIQILKGIDYKTLLFFIGLFIVIGGLEQTGLLNLLANLICKISGGNLYLMCAIILWVSAITSAFVDNIPFAATMVPVIKTMAATQNINIGILAWTLSLGVDLGGNATPIGASANVVGTSVAAKDGYYITWGKYCKYAAPATILVTFISMVMIFAKYL